MLTNGWPLMGHPTDGLLRAYLDGELPADQKRRISRHLKGCSRCRSRYTAIQADAAWAAAELGALRALAEAAPLPEPKRWETPGQRESGAARVVSKPNHGGLLTLKHKVSAGWIAAAAAAVLAVGSLSFPSVRAAAAQWITVFRVDQAQVVRISLDDLQNISMDHEALESLMNEMTELVQQEEIQEPTVQTELTVPELAAWGFLAPSFLPEGFTAADGIAVQGGEVLLRVDVDGVNQLLASLGQDERLPEDLKGQVLRLESGAGVGAIYRRGDEVLRVMQSDVPTLSASGNVDLNEIFSTFSGLLGDQFGVSATLREQLSRVDLNQTVPLPLLEGSGTEVTVNGVTGTYNGDETGGSVLWVQDGRLYMVAGPLSQPELLQIAASIGK